MPEVTFTPEQIAVIKQIVAEALQGQDQAAWEAKVRARLAFHANNQVVANG